MDITMDLRSLRLSVLRSACDIVTSGVISPEKIGGTTSDDVMCIGLRGRNLKIRTFILPQRNMQWFIS